MSQLCISLITMTGQELKILRERKGLTQRELAEKVGTNFARISDWETGKRKISNAYVQILKTFFQV